MAQLQPLDPMKNTTRPNCSQYLIQLQPSPMPKGVHHSSRNHHHNTHTTTATFRPTSPRATCHPMYIFPGFAYQINQLCSLSGRIYHTTRGPITSLAIHSPPTIGHRRSVHDPR
jgi:hypothetical protein